MYQHSRSFVGTMLKERNDAFVVQVSFTDMIADLHTDMPVFHRAAQFFTGRIGILQRHLTE